MLLFRGYLLKAIFLIAVSLLLVGCTGSSSPADFQSILQNLASSYPALWKMLTAAAYVLGWGLVLKAVYALKAYGESRTMMSSNTSIKGPMAYFFAGAMLIFTPAAFTMINMTFFGTPNIMSYTGGGVAQLSQTSVLAVLGVVQIVGLLAFIRGWMYLSKAGDHSGGQPVMGKALTHIFGGALAINVVQIKDVIWNTFGFS